MSAEDVVTASGGPRRASARAMALAEALDCTSYDLGLLDAGKLPPVPAPGLLGRQRAARADLLAYLAALEAALDFYADPARYADTAKRVLTPDGDIADVCSVLADGGAIARAARDGTKGARE